MTVGAKRIEGDDDLRLARGGCGWRSSLRPRSQSARSSSASSSLAARPRERRARRGRAQFCLSGAANDFGPRLCAFVVEPAALASRRRHDVCADPFPRILRQHAACSQRLIIGVGEHAHQAQVWSQQLSSSAVILLISPEEPSQTALRVLAYPLHSARTMFGRQHQSHIPGLAGIALWLSRWRGFSQPLSPHRLSHPQAPSMAS